MQSSRSNSPLLVSVLALLVVSCAGCAGDSASRPTPGGPSGSGSTSHSRDHALGGTSSASVDSTSSVESSRGGGRADAEAGDVAPALHRGNGSERHLATSAAATREADPIAARARQLLEGLTLEQKVGQLMMVGFGGTELDADIEALVGGLEVGGVCMFKRNVRDAEQIATLNHGVTEILRDSIPPFIAVDQEGGNVVRVSDGAVVLPGNMALGATRSKQLAYEAGRAQAEDLLRLGFNMNLAPVLDVNVDPENPVIGIRAYGDDVTLVSQLGRAYVRGQSDADIVTLGKHFPGHGAVDADSHLDLPVSHASLAEVLSHLEPFQAAAEGGMDGVMTAHIAIPSVAPGGLPATLSEEILEGLLRRRLGFDGLVVTDELEMKAIAERWGVGKAAVMAVAAGADMVLVPWRPAAKAEVHAALLEASRSGALSRERVDEAVTRILRVKLRRGLFDPPPSLEARLASVREHRPSDVDRRIARGSITLLTAATDGPPLKREDRISVISPISGLANAILARAPGAARLDVPGRPHRSLRPGLRRSVARIAAEADVVVVGLLNAHQLELVDEARQSGKPVVVVSMGLPYLTDRLGDDMEAVLATYSYGAASTDAAAAALFGEQPTPGRLPVKLRRHAFGSGLVSFDAPVVTSRSGVGASAAGSP